MIHDVLLAGLGLFAALRLWHLCALILHFACMAGTACVLHAKGYVAGLRGFALAALLVLSGLPGLVVAGLLPTWAKPNYDRYGYGLDW